MKKFIPVAALAVFALMFTSCKKDYTCTCTFVDPSGTLSTTTTAYSLGKQKKSDAENACKNYLTTAGGGVTTGWTCHLWLI